MGVKYSTGAVSCYVGQCVLTSVVLSPKAGQLSATITLYNATAATAGTEVMFLYAGTAPHTVTWSDPEGILCDNLWAVTVCANATVVWR